MQQVGSSSIDENRYNSRDLSCKVGSNCFLDQIVPDQIAFWIKLFRIKFPSGSTSRRPACNLTYNVTVIEKFQTVAYFSQS